MDCLGINMHIVPRDLCILITRTHARIGDKCIFHLLLRLVTSSPTAVPEDRLTETPPRPSPVKHAI